MAIALRYAARSDVGLVRQNNQDSGYAGPHLLVVADGMGGHAGGDVASSLAIGELAPLDDESHGPDALAHLSQAVLAAHRELLGRVDEEPQLAGMGTTITALLRTGSRLALAHIGDSRAYLVRDGIMVQITRDHTFVQTLIDEGRLTPEEAEQHPQRSVLMRVLSDVVEDVEPDLSMREAKVGDRYLLCSDGLSGVVSFDTLRDTLSAGDDPRTTCENLVQLALRGGAPDNVTCIVADVIEAARLGDNAPSVVGAASATPQVRSASANGSAAERAAALTATGTPVTPEPEKPPRRGRTLRRSLGGLLAVVLVAGAGGLTWRWMHDQYFVGADSEHVAIFQGLPDSLGPVSLAWVDTVADDVPLADLPEYQQQQVREGITVDSSSAASSKVEELRAEAEACRAATASPSVTASATPTPTASGSATASGSGTATASASGSAAAPATAGDAVASVTTADPTTAPTTDADPTLADGATGTAATGGEETATVVAADCGGLSE